jgi:hypothetical protein
MFRKNLNRCKSKKLTQTLLYSHKEASYKYKEMHMSVNSQSTYASTNYSADRSD